jgi:hypothetical protein
MQMFFRLFESSVKIDNGNATNIEILANRAKNKNIKIKPMPSALTKEYIPI